MFSAGTYTILAYHNVYVNAAELVRLSQVSKEEEQVLTM
jgi:hypothetical protein